jgi:hypothetical protein
MGNDIEMSELLCFTSFYLVISDYRHSRQHFHFLVKIGMAHRHFRNHLHDVEIRFFDMFLYVSGYRFSLIRRIYCFPAGSVLFVSTEWVSKGSFK